MTSNAFSEATSSPSTKRITPSTIKTTSVDTRPWAVYPKTFSINPAIYPLSRLRSTPRITPERVGS